MEKYGPSIKREDNKPKFINPKCKDCGTPLVPVDTLYTPGVSEDKIWWDEWACPKCHDTQGISLDWPEQALKDF